LSCDNWSGKLRWQICECSHVGLLGELDFPKALTGADHVLVLDTHDTTTPVSALLVVVVVLLAELDGELLQVLHVLFLDFSEGNTGSGLHVAEFAESGLTAEEAVWDVLSAAKSGQMDHALNGVNVVSDDHELGLVLFNEGSDVVETELKVHGLGALGDLLLGVLEEAGLLLLLGLGLVLTEELEELGGLVGINGVGELVDGWWDLEAVEQDALLSLDAHVLGPSDETGEVLGLHDIATDTEVSSGLLEEGLLGVGGLVVTDDNLLGNLLNHCVFQVLN